MAGRYCYFCCWLMVVVLLALFKNESLNYYFLFRIWFFIHVSVSILVYLLLFSNYCIIIIIVTLLSLLSFALLVISRHGLFGTIGIARVRRPWIALSSPSFTTRVRRLGSSHPCSWASVRGVRTSSPSDGSPSPHHRVRTWKSSGSW